MKILQVHNEYLKPGGEDVVLDLEKKLLQENGHIVDQYIVTNKDIKTDNAAKKIALGLNTVWSFSSFQKFLKCIEQQNPDVIHIHNTFTQLSPSIYWAASYKNIPVVQTWHNYRITCVNGLLLKDGRPCEKCIGSSNIHGVVNKCYRDSYSASFTVSAMQSFNKLIGSYTNKVNKHIALTGFAKKKIVQSGIPDNTATVKPNFIYDPSYKLENRHRKNQIVFVGRIAEEKGLDILLEAWSHIHDNPYKLVVIGDGPEKETLQKNYPSENIIWKGWLDRSDVLEEVSLSKFLVMASKWYEGFPMVLLEALAVGTPLLLPSHAAFPEIVENEITGFLFEPLSISHLKDKLETSIELSGKKWEMFSVNARESYLKKYTPEKNYNLLIDIYKSVIEEGSR